MTETAIGLGRVCADEFVLEKRRVERFDSVKSSYQELGFAVGGSVPRILACLSRRGYRAVFVGPGAKPSDENQMDSLTETVVRPGLAGLDVEFHMIERPRTMRSLVVLGANGELLSDSSWEEAEEDYLPPDSATELICDLDSVECVVLDARHISAARTLADVGHERGALVILDPGSTVGALFRSDAERTAVRSLVAKCDVVLGSDSFYKALANTDAVADAVEAALELGPQLIVATAKDGTCCCTSRRFDFQVAPIRVSTAGNSLGAGDLFKGWFAAELLSRAGSRTDKLLLTYENTLEATRVAVAAAAWRISDHGMFVEIPSDDEVRHLAMQPVTR